MGPAPHDTLAHHLCGYNFYFCTEDLEWGERHLQKMRPYGIEMHSASADPLFYDLAGGEPGLLHIS